MTSKENSTTMTYKLTRCFWVLSIIIMKMAIQPNPTSSSEQGRKLPQYCLPEEWQGGRMSTLAVVRKSGESSVKRTFSIITYSARQQKMATDDNLYQWRGRYTRRIFDYPAKVLYTITGDGNQKCCKKTPLPGPFLPQCVPDNATVTLVSTTLGTGSNNVAAMELSGIQTKVNYRISLINDTHVPIFEQLWGETNEREPFIQTQSFYNVSLSASIPPVVFEPPSFCNQVSGDVHEMPDRSSEDEQFPVLVMP